MIKKLGIATGVIFLLTASACKTKEIVPQITEDVKPAQNISNAEQLLLKVDSMRHTYTNLNIKYAAAIKLGKDENSIRGKLKIRRDSCVWVTALPLGIEAARIIATEKEAGLINYLKKEYFLGDYSLLSSQIGYTVDYFMLQAILTGAPIFMEDRKSYQLVEDKTSYYFSVYNKDQFEKISTGKELSNKNDIQALWFSKSDYTLSKNVLYDAPQRRYLEINYSNYQWVGTNMIPFKIDIEIRTPKQEGTFAIEYMKVEENIPGMEYPFTVPESYSKIEWKK